jgi:sugar (pentulose or hexulose) kinase
VNGTTRHLLDIDVSTTGAKALLIDDKGAAVASAGAKGEDVVAVGLIG